MKYVLYFLTIGAWQQVLSKRNKDAGFEPLTTSLAYAVIVIQIILIACVGAVIH